MKIPQGARCISARPRRNVYADHLVRLFFAICVCEFTVAGQMVPSLQGHVKDAQGGGVADVQLRLFRQDSATSLSAISTGTGEYQFIDVEPGAFLLDVQKQGFRETTIPVAVERNKVMQLDVTLEVAGVNQTVVVTAAAEAQSIDEVSKSVSVTRRDEIMARNDYALSDILSIVPGVQIFNQGGSGQFTRMSIRGLQSSAGAILIDGFRFRDASTTQGDASSFLPTLNFIDADRVEVLRGSGSSLYGTNAVGGAVNVVTDQGGGPFHGDLQVEGGNLGFFRARGSIAGGALGDRVQYAFGLLHLNVMSGVDGQDANRSTGLQGFTRYDFSPKLSFSGRFWGSDDFVQLNNSPTNFGIPYANIPLSTIVQAIPLSRSGVATLLAGGIPNYGNATYIPNANDPDDRRSSRFENAAFVFRDILTPSVNWQASYQVVHTDRTYENGPLGIGFQPVGIDLGNYIGTIQTVDLRAAAQPAPWLTLTGGYEFERENYFDHQDNNLPTPQRVSERTYSQQDSNAGFAAVQLALLKRRLEVSLSGRVQNFQLFTPDFQYTGTENPYAGVQLSAPKALTGDASIAYLTRKSNTKFRAHVGNSYRAPALFERFGAGFSNNFATGGVTFTPYGDPRLAPDRYNSVDTGIDQYLFSNRLRVSATFFYIRAVQLIAFDSNGVVNPATDPFGRSAGYINGAGGISRGAEISVEARPTRSLTLSASYTYTNADTDRDSLVPGFFRAFDTPKHTVTLVARNQWTRKLATTLDLVHYSSYFDPAVGFLQAYEFPGFTNTNLVASYQFWNNDRQSAKLYAKIANLFNQTYYVSGFLAPGTTFVTGIGYSF